MANDTTRLLGLEGVQVTAVELGEDGTPRLALTTCDQAARRCPQCGFASNRPHSNVTTRPRDLAVAGRRTELTWHKKRWRCIEPSCPRATFTERIPQVPARARLTARLRAQTGADVR